MVQGFKGPKVQGSEGPRTRTIDDSTDLAVPFRIRQHQRMAEERRQPGEAVKERVAPKQQDPTRYKVLLINDDYTTMQFVVEVLETVFAKSPAEAYRVMMQVHHHGSGVAGIYPWELAETKVAAVTSLARAAGFPLRAVAEEA